MADVVPTPVPTSEATSKAQTQIDPKSVLYDIDLIKSNTLTKVILGVTGSDAIGLKAGDTTIEAWTSDDISISGDSTWSSAYEESLAVKYARQFTDIIQRVGQSKAFPVFTLQHPLQVLKSWSGTGDLKIELDLWFIASDAKHDVTADAARLLNLVYPIVSDKQSFMVISPLGHDMVSNGFISLRIGDWFVADPWFVCTNVSNTIAIKPTRAKHPLYCRSHVSLVSAKMVSIKEIRRWLLQEAGTPRTDLTLGNAIDTFVPGGHGATLDEFLKDPKKSVEDIAEEVLKLVPANFGGGGGQAATPSSGTTGGNSNPPAPAAVPASTVGGAGGGSGGADAQATGGTVAVLRRQMAATIAARMIQHQRTHS